MYVYHTKFIIYAIFIRFPFKDIWHICVVVELIQLFESNTQHLCRLCNAILTLYSRYALIGACLRSLKNSIPTTLKHIDLHRLFALY